MSFSFKPNASLIIVGAEVTGPTGTAWAQLALNTGASTSLINVGVLVALGYDPALSPTRVQMTTGSGVEFVPLVTINRMRALGRDHSDLPVLAHTLPPSAVVDGLLGLDFLRG